MCVQGADVEIEDVVRRRLDHHLELVVVLQAERVLAIAAVGRSTRRLHIGGAPGFRADGAQEGGGVEGAGADFHVVRLQQHAALGGPVLLERQDQVLEGARRQADFRVAMELFRGAGGLADERAEYIGSRRTQGCRSMRRPVQVRLLPRADALPRVNALE